MLVCHSQSAGARLVVAAVGAAFLSACAGTRMARVTSPASHVAVYGDTLRLVAFASGDTLYFSYPLYYAHAAAVHYGVRVVARGDSVHSAQFVYTAAETAVAVAEYPTAGLPQAACAHGWSAVGRRGNGKATANRCARWG